jgi:outer membrane protein assembly factor BamB
MVYVFFGKSGIHAVNMEGKHVWDKNVGTELDQRGWGSASSPILYKDVVIVPATVENHAIIALDKKTGEKKWEQIADGFGSTWGTPVLVETGERNELVIGVPYEFWSLNPDDGKLLWYCEAINSNSICSSVITHDGVIYGVESGPGGGGVTGVAVKAGGKGDVTKTHKVWENRERSRIGTPVIHEGLMYYISSGIANAVDIKTGEKVYQERLQANASGENQGNNQEERPRGFGQPGGRGGFQFGGGRGGGQDYSSPIIADGKIFYAKRNGDIYVLKAGKEFEQLAVNRFESADGDFNASPAVSSGELFIRSSRVLYCVSNEEGEKGR